MYIFTTRYQTIMTLASLQVVMGKSYKEIRRKHALIDEVEISYTEYESTYTEYDSSI